MDQRNINSETSKLGRFQLPYLGLFESSGVLLLIGTGLYFVHSPWGEWVLVLGVLVGVYGFVQLVQDGDFWMDEPNQEVATQTNRSLPAKRMCVLVGVYLGAIVALLSLGAFVSQWDDGATFLLSPLLALFLVVADIVVIAQKSKWPSICRRSKSFSEGMWGGFGMASFYSFSLAIAGSIGVGVATQLSKGNTPKPQPAIPGQPNVRSQLGTVNNQNDQRRQLGTINVDYWNATVRQIPGMIRVEPDPTLPRFLNKVDLSIVRSAAKRDNVADAGIKDLADRFLANVAEYRRLVDTPQPPRSTMENLAMEKSTDALPWVIFSDLPPPSFSGEKKPKGESPDTKRLDRLATKIFAAMAPSVSERTTSNQLVKEIERVQARLWLNLLEAYELRGRLKAEYSHQKFSFPWEAEEQTLDDR